MGAEHSPPLPSSCDSAITQQVWACPEGTDVGTCLSIPSADWAITPNIPIEVHLPEIQVWFFTWNAKLRVNVFITTYFKPNFDLLEAAH